MNKIKRLYEFQCLKTGYKWYREDREMTCPVKSDCNECINVIGYCIIEVIHSAELKEKIDDTIYKSCGL